MLIVVRHEFGENVEAAVKLEQSNLRARRGLGQGLTAPFAPCWYATVGAEELTISFFS